MKTTLREIFKHGPCGRYCKRRGWGLLLKNLGKTRADDEPLDLMEILKSNGIADAVWALRCFEYRDCCLFLADIIESVLPIFEREHPSDNRPRLLIDGICDFYSGNITKEELENLRCYYNFSMNRAYHVKAACGYATHNNAYIIACNVVAAVGNAAKWQEIEELFIKNFGGVANNENNEY